MILAPSPPELEHRAGVIAESFDEYREEIADMVIFDERGGLQGLSKRAYILRGIQEEIREIYVPTPEDIQ